MTNATSFWGTTSNVLVIDVSDLRQPTVVRYASLTGSTAGRDIILHAATAYVSGPSQNMLTAIDMSDPSNPGPQSATLGFTDLQGLCSKDAEHILAADGAGGVRLIDV